MDRNYAIDKDGNTLSYRTVVRRYLARDTKDWDTDIRTWTRKNIGKVVGK